MPCPCQDEIHKIYHAGSALHMMCWMNFWCGLFYLPFMFVLSGAGRDLFAFCAEFPEVRSRRCSWTGGCRLARACMP